ncbi:MAG: hypothetical protein Ta2B_09430 [Termitinemataceae bacterium]|nr:MAG: hypothetical protein Ta2B_09430 [Termitinemataceae bacterium]
MAIQDNERENEQEYYYFICPKCGHKQNAENIFCRCGHKLIEAANGYNRLFTTNRNPMLQKNNIDTAKANCSMCKNKCYGCPQFGHPTSKHWCGLQRCTAALKSCCENEQRLLGIPERSIA